MDVAPDQPTVKELLDRIDAGWDGFSHAVHALPAELLEARLGDDGWTRKQMLAHIAVWHDLTVERLAALVDTGVATELQEDDDAINARAARGAVGRTTGEILLALDESFRRLRREIARMTNEQLALHDSWAVSVVGSNTYGHYREHLPDLDRKAA